MEVLRKTVLRRNYELQKDRCKKTIFISSLITTTTAVATE